MACDDCDHTMNGIGDGLFWCPRCGSLKDVTGPSPDGRGQTVTPKLVERCREFGPKLGPEYLSQCGHLAALWRNLGIAESIHPLAARTHRGSLT